MDHWLSFTDRLQCTSDAEVAVQYLQQVLGPITYLVGHNLTIADFAVWGALRGDLETVFFLSFLSFMLDFTINILILKDSCIEDPRWQL